MKLTNLKYSILTIGTLLFFSCNSTKYVKENEFLLEKNTIKVDGNKTSDIEITPYLIQRPNNKVFGIPVEIYLYNIGDVNYDSIYQKKHNNIINRNSVWDKIFSKKQTLKLVENRRNFNNWFLTKGEAPVVLDDLKTKTTAEKLRTHFFNNGFFDSSIKTTIIADNKKASVIYNITKKDPFFIDEITYKIDSKEVEKTVKEHQNKIPLKQGQQYNLETFKKSIQKTTQLLRNNGFYHFSEGLISFRGIDTLNTEKKTPVSIVIENRKVKKGNQIIELPTKIQTIKKVSVYTDYSYSSRNNIYNIHKNFKLIDFYAHNKLKHKSKTLANSIFIEPNQIYTDKNIELTRQHLRSLNNFKAIKINHKELPNNELETIILLTPQKKYGIGLNTEIIHSNIKQVGLSGGFSFINRNLLRGAEIFQLSLQGSIFDAATRVNGESSSGFEAYEVGIDASLEFPKFIFPFLSNIVPRTMTPKTKITVGTSFQKNIGLDKQKLTGLAEYNWKSSSRNSHTIELLNLQFINNLNKESYYNIYSSEYQKVKEIQPKVRPFNLTPLNASAFIKSVPASFAQTNPEDFTIIKNIGKREDIITSNNIIPSFSYAFEHNSKKGLSDNRYNYFRTRISSTGNLNSHFFEKKQNERVFQNIPISQFVKVDIDFRKFWSNSPNHSLAFRSFIGVAVPTGRNKDIPFISSYFAGGSNDIRAWKTYELGPGSSNTGLEFNIGNLKLLSSLEYRFKIINSINGAIFADAGNIWNLPNTTASSDEEIFSGIDSLENIALGTGFGIRYDFNFLVLRLDLAFKTYEPYLENNKWLSSYKLIDSVLNIGINYPF